MNSSSEGEDSSTSHSISRSPSPALSLEEQAEQEDPSPPTLERLVLHFVSAKRSLASTTHVYRANELVTHSRSLIEETALLNSKNAFSRKALTSQIDTLSAIRDTITTEDSQIAADFAAKVQKLDAAHERLAKTLQGLKGTIVASQKTPPSSSTVVQPASESEEQTDKEDREEEEEEEEEKTLYSFIDPTLHQNLITSIRSGIDSYTTRRSQTASLPLSNLSRSLKSLTQALSSPSTADASSSSSHLRRKPSTIYSREERSPTATLFHTLSSDAQHLAELLGQLVKHYDLCVEALKHTEGGGEAARLALATVDDDGMVDVESLYKQRYALPMDPGEREGMLRVLVGDAGEVEDVVGEIGELGEGMEGIYGELVARAEQARAEFRALQDVYVGLKALRTGVLPSILQTLAEFYRTFYTELEERLKGDLGAMVDLVQFYEEFQRSYERLLGEVQRRDKVRERARGIAEKAQRELDRLWEVDREAREGFVEDVGGFIPRDLGVRFGMEDRGVRWVVGEEEG